MDPVNPASGEREEPYEEATGDDVAERVGDVYRTWGDRPIRECDRSEADSTAFVHRATVPTA